ncbi:alpha/beta hydrolase family protein [Actinoplanes hulinensis]|uniref:Alpha/beta hydrolase family protein n=2 Tax=Actinoplanes hulinensis TaxID=1144547 RepID=A0ABS7AX95_9ACTN|nr:alpha/beta hydrolase family protein [Actinoplanes hulinensis]
MDGIPAEDRDEANRTALANQKRNVLDQLASHQGDPAELREQLERINKVEDALSKLGDRGFLLGVDTEAHAGHGKVIIAAGNPDTARHTGVWVPGLSTTLYGSMDDNIDRIVRMNDTADKLTLGRGGDVSTVYWLGYDAPDLDNASVLMNSRSEAGRDPYLNFVTGLRATHEGDAGHLVAMGHSYGSTVVGEAAKTGGLPVDDIVVAGSPGMHVDNASQLGDAGHVWAGASSTDPVADAKFAEPWDKVLVPGMAPGIWAVETAADSTHGDAPTSDGFGGNNWVADTGGHTSYWEPDSQSLKNQARVLAGVYDEVTLNSGTAPGNLR